MKERERWKRNGKAGIKKNKEVEGKVGENTDRQTHTHRDTVLK